MPRLIWPRNTQHFCSMYHGSKIPGHRTEMNRLWSQPRPVDTFPRHGYKNGSMEDMASTPQLLRAKNLFRAAPELDERQRNIIDQPPGHGPILLLGGPGTGKTTTAVEYAVAKIKAGVPTSQVLLLTNTRTAATQLRTQLTARLNQEAIDSRAETPVRSFAPYAFDLINRIREDETTTPRLLAGAEQDRVIDRKSTRLNSSHVAISYAVFCL